MDEKRWIDDRVSVIMPCYNGETHIHEAMESVMAQTYQNWELIVVDDGSTDASRQIVAEYARRDTRIMALESAGNEGAAVARNKGMAMASGRYIAFLDSDDFWATNKLQKQVEYMRKLDVGFTFTAYQSVDEWGNLKKIIRVPETMTYQKLLRNTIIGCLTVMLDRNIVGEVRMPKLRSRQDTATWLGILKKGHVAYGMPNVLAYYRVVSGSLSSNKWKMVHANWRMYREEVGLPAWRASYCMVGYMANAVKKRIF